MFRARKKIIKSGPTTPQVAFFTVSQWPRMRWACSPRHPRPVVTDEPFGWYFFQDGADLADYLNKLGLEVWLNMNYIKRNHYFKLKYKPLPWLFNTPSRRFDMTDHEDDQDLTPSEMRELAQSKGISFLNDIKAQQLTEATETQIHEVWLQLAPTTRRLYKAIMDDLNLMIKNQELKQISELEKSRIAMLRVGELLGMSELFESATIAKESETLQKYIEIARKLGNESARMLEENKNSSGKDDSFFDKLKKLDNIEVTFKKQTPAEIPDEVDKK